VNLDYSLGLIAVIENLASPQTARVLTAVAAVLLRAGGLDALQAASIVVGLPLAGLMVLVGVGRQNIWDKDRSSLRDSFGF
jgi:choline-glycine betaine transporter